MAGAALYLALLEMSNFQELVGRNILCCEERSYLRAGVVAPAASWHAAPRERYRGVQAVAGAAAAGASVRAGRGASDLCMHRAPLWHHSHHSHPGVRLDNWCVSSALHPACLIGKCSF